MKKETLEERMYEANPHTMVILPKFVGENIFSEVHEMTGSLISKYSPFEIIKHSCRFFGSNFEGRKDGTKHLIGITHKPPIIVDAMNLIYTFPTTSPAKDECIWVFPQHIYEYTPTEFNQTAVQFVNHQTIEIDISIASFNNQMARTSMLHMKISQKMRKLEQDFPAGNLYFPPTTLAAESKTNYQVQEKNKQRLDRSFFQ